jgi:hypothetical protein
MELHSVGRFLIMAGVVIAIVGLVFIFADSFGLGKLPGDVSFGKGSAVFKIPVVTVSLVAILVTFAVNFFSS